LIISGGNIEVDFALKILKEKFDKIIAVDGGAKFCYEYQIFPTFLVGDFDTLEPQILNWYKENTKTEIREFQPEKDATDTQIAVELAISLGSTQITILGGTGSRMDHVLGNIQTMYLALQKGIKCQMLDPCNRIQLIQNDCKIRREEQYGDYFSLIPLTTEVSGVTLRGVKYPLDHHCFTVLGSAGFGVSNEIVEEQAEILISDGVLILIEAKEKS